MPPSSGYTSPECVRPSNKCTERNATAELTKHVTVAAVSVLCMRDTSHLLFPAVTIQYQQLNMTSEQLSLNQAPHLWKTLTRSFWSRRISSQCRSHSPGLLRARFSLIQRANEQITRHGKARTLDPEPQNSNVKSGGRTGLQQR